MNSYHLTWHIKNKIIQRYNICQLCQMSLFSGDCGVLAAVHLVRVGTAPHAVSRDHCGFRLMGCHFCPSHGCYSCCSIQAVICPGGPGSSSRWPGRWWLEKLEKHFDILLTCPNSFTRALPSKGEGELDYCPQKGPSSRGERCPKKQVMFLSPQLTILLPAQPAAP